MTALRIKLHWLIVVLLLLQYLLKGGMHDTMAAVRLGDTPAALDYLIAQMHLINGVSIAAIMIWRLILRRRALQAAQNDPAADSGNRSADGLQPGLQKLAARHATAVHYALYIVLLLLPVTGLAAFYEFPAAAALHHYSQWVLLALILCHLAGALYHLLWLRDGVVGRMFERQR